MRALLLTAAFFGPVAAAHALIAPLGDLKQYPLTSHGSWSSYTVHTEATLSVHFVRVGPGSLRPVYKLDADSISVSMRYQRVLFPRMGSGKFKLFQRGDILTMRAGEVQGGWGATAKGAGVEALFITRSKTMPKDLSREAGMQLKVKGAGLYPFKDARAKVDAMTGATRLAPVFEAPRLRADLVRLTGLVALKNDASATAILFPVEGAGKVRTGGASVGLKRDEIFLAGPGATIELTQDGDQPCYILLITSLN